MTPHPDEQARELADWFAEKYMEPKRAPTYSYAEMADKIAALLAKARLAALEEAAHFVETHWCENDMQNNYKVHERKPHPNEPLAKAIRSLRQAAGERNG